MRRSLFMPGLLLVIAIMGTGTGSFASIAESSPTPPESLKVNIEFPALPFDSYDSKVAATVENVVTQTVIDMMTWLLPFGEVVGSYEVNLHQDHILSVTLQYAAYRRPMAHPAHLATSLTFDMTTGKRLELADLFRGDDYIEVLSRHVSEQISERAIPLLREFEHIEPNQDFHLTPEGLVMYFQPYDLAPYYWGFPKFTIPYEAIDHIEQTEVLRGLTSPPMGTKPTQ